MWVFGQTVRPAQTRGNEYAPTFQVQEAVVLPPPHTPCTRLQKLTALQVTQENMPARQWAKGLQGNGPSCPWQCVGCQLSSGVTTNLVMPLASTQFLIQF